MISAATGVMVMWLDKKHTRTRRRGRGHWTVIGEKPGRRQYYLGGRSDTSAVAVTIPMNRPAC